MKSWMLMLILLIQASIGYADEVKSIFSKHKTLIENGWSPLPLSCEFPEDKESRWRYNDAQEIFEAGVKSIHSCQGTGKNYCSFYYIRPNKCLKVVTSGEFSYKGLNGLLVSGEYYQCPDEC